MMRILFLNSVAASQNIMLYSSIVSAEISSHLEIFHEIIKMPETVERW